MRNTLHIRGICVEMKENEVEYLIDTEMCGSGECYEERKKRK